MDNSDSGEQLKIKAIPEMSCKEPVYSILRLPVDLPPSIDTTDLVGLYGYTEEDFSAVWSPSISVLGEEDYSDSESVCLVGDNVTESGDIYISFLPSAETIAALRNWVIRVLPCGVDSSDSDSSSSQGETGSVSLGGVVRFSNRPITSLSIPTFIPRSGGSRRPDESSSSGEDGSCCKHQFTVQAAAGGITIVDGHNPGSSVAGMFNNYPVNAVSISLSSVGTYYIYIIDWELYALTHTFYSDLVASLRIATVTVSSSGISVSQESYQDYPVSYARESLYDGVSTFTVTKSYSNHRMSMSYALSARVLRNNYLLETNNGSGGTALALSADGLNNSLYVYTQRLTTQSYSPTTVDTGFGFTLPSPTPEWYTALVQYRWTTSASVEDFRLIHRTPTPYLFNFSYLPLNSIVESM